jgi:hypothetical protein
MFVYIEYNSREIADCKVNMGPKSWLLSEHLAAFSCLVITTNLSEYHHGALCSPVLEVSGALV